MSKETNDFLKMCSLVLFIVSLGFIHWALPIIVVLAMIIVSLFSEEENEEQP